MTSKLLAWLVHAYTAAGLVAAAGMAVLIVRGGDDAFRWAFMLMVVATAIDSTDGWLARKARVKEVLPGFDGRTLDDLTDFHTYTSLPLFIIWRADILPGALAWFLLLPLVASAYGFSRTDAKTDDGFFLGFPSYWNVVAFYLYLLAPPAWVSFLVIVACSALTFAPMRYLYLTRGGPFAKAMLMVGGVWAAFTAVIVLRPADERRTLALVSLIYPIVYVVLSWAITIRFSYERRVATRAARIATIHVDHR
jgi:phosphatidylcholine synthase